MSPGKAIEKALKLYHRGGVCVWAHMAMGAACVCVCGWVEKLLAFEKPAATCRIFICTCIYTRKFSTWSSPKSPENRAYLRRQAYRAAGSQQHCFNKYKVMDIHTHTHVHRGLAVYRGEIERRLKSLNNFKLIFMPSKGNTRACKRQSSLCRN